MSENVKAGTVELGAISEDDDNPQEAIGFITFSTTGELFVKREWLKEQWDTHNLPSSLLPKQTSNWQAYRRAINYIQNKSENLSYKVEVEDYNQEFDCSIEIEKNKEKGTNVFLIYAEIFFPEEVIGIEDGNKKTERIGKFDFYRPEENIPGGMLTEKQISDDSPHYKNLQKLFKEAKEAEKKMRKTHNFNDLNNILETFRNENDAVEIRRSVYFLPAMCKGTLNSLMDVWRKMDKFKEEGEHVRIDKTPVVDMREQRELVKDRVQEKLEVAVNSVVGEVLEEFEDATDKTAEDAATDILEQLSNEKSIEKTYNQILGVELSIKDILKEEQKELQEESEEIIENVIKQQTFDELEVE